VNLCGTGFQTNQFEKKRQRAGRVTSQRKGVRRACLCGRMVRVLDQVCKCGLPVVRKPFMGVGSEVCAAIQNERRGLGIELKPSYYQQAVINAAKVATEGLDGVLNETFQFDEAEEIAADAGGWE
jgi:hypothetical protein